METVHLYTRQHENSLHELESRGEITNKEYYVRLHMRDIADFFSTKYGRFVSMAEKRVARPEGVEYPIWCSVSKKNCLKPIEKEVVYCLEVPLEEVIYFDGAKWDLVLNDEYIATDREDDRRFYEKTKDLGTFARFDFKTGRYMGGYPELGKEISDSWERIFVIDNWNEFVVQANLWHIKKEWVRHIVHIGEDLFEIAKDMEETFPPSFVRIGEQS